MFALCSFEAYLGLNVLICLWNCTAPSALLPFREYFSFKQQVFKQHVSTVLKNCWLSFCCYLSFLLNKYISTWWFTKFLKVFCFRIEVGRAEATVMGVSGKWIRSLIGLKRPEKSLATEKDDNVSMIFLIMLFCLPIYLFFFSPKSFPI